jgi:hypothetical protein
MFKVIALTASKDILWIQLLVVNVKIFKILDSLNKKKILFYSFLKNKKIIFYLLIKINIIFNIINLKECP